MEQNKLYKVVYEDSSNIKVLKGILIGEDEHTLTLQVESDKVVMIGKRYLQKATNVNEVY